MLLAKNNLFRSLKGLAYIVNDGLVSFNDINIEMDADEYQRQNQPSGNGRGRPNVKTKEAEAWLREYLKDGAKPSGPIQNPEPGTVFCDAEAVGIKYRTLRRVADELQIRKVKETFSGRWMWSLPEEKQDETVSGFSEFDAFGEEDF